MVNVFFPVNRNPYETVLNSGEVHVWAACIPADCNITLLTSVLSLDEMYKAGQYNYYKEQNCFLFSRWMLRTLLGIYLRENPSVIRFAFTQYGKPFIAEDHVSDRIHFNISHSGEMVIFAFTRESDIGIDIEHLREVPEMDEIAVKYFSGEEYKAYKSIPEGKRVKSFFNCWTRKESFIKAVGNGFSIPLSSFSVSFTFSEPAQILNINGNRKLAGGWSLLNLKPANGYTAAVAIEQKRVNLRCFNAESLLKTNIFQNK